MSQTRRTFRVGTRGSQLARVQTDMIVAALSRKHSDIEFSVLPITTTGDRVLNKPLHAFGGAGVFVKELEEALMANEVDIVVHSLKDMPTLSPDQLTLAAVLLRGDPRDVFLSRKGETFASLAAGARVATSSRRREAQLKIHREDLTFVDVRGNVPTRLKKLADGEADGMVLAAAGLIRLGLSDQIKEFFEPSFCLPAPGQAALGVQCRRDDGQTIELAKAINNPIDAAETTAERSLLARLGSGCSLPVGALARSSGKENLTLSACIAAGGKVLNAQQQGTILAAEKLGQELADELIQRGALELLREARPLAPNAISPP